MGLAERRAATEFENGRFPALKKSLDEAADFNVQMFVDWESLAIEGFSHLYADTWPKVYFDPLIAAFKSVTQDTMGREALKLALKKVTIQNKSSTSSASRFGAFSSGVLTLDHLPTTNVGNGKERSDALQKLLEKNLREGSMGLAERRAAKEFETSRYPALKKQIDEAAGWEVQTHVDWESLAIDDSAHLYADCWTKVYFDPLVEALKATTADTMGQEALKAGLKKIVIQNKADLSSGSRVASFSSGVLTLDHKPTTNVGNTRERSDAIRKMLEKNLREGSMGLAERRGAKEFETTHYPELKKQIDAAAGWDVQLFVDWESLAVEDQVHLYASSWPKVYFNPLTTALKVICADDMGKEALKSKLKKIIIQNKSGNSSGSGIANFSNGILTIDHKPTTNVSNERERAEAIQKLLEKNL